MTAVAEGWGGSPWGDTPWGAGETGLALASAVAVRENAVRLEFTTAPVFDGLLTPHDASAVSRYALTAVSGASLEGEPVRPVLPVFVEVAGGGGTLIDVWVDRPFTGYPAVYRVTANNLIAAAGGAFLSPGASATFLGVRAGKAPPTKEHAVAGKDFLIAQVGSDLAGANVPGDPSKKLGFLSVAGTGDYASATPLAAYRIRVLRRATTLIGSFAHLPSSYGTVLPSRVKRPANASTTELIAAQLEAQIKLEPETVSVDVTVLVSASGAVRYRIVARARFGTIDESVPG